MGEFCTVSRQTQSLKSAPIRTTDFSANVQGQVRSAAQPHGVTCTDWLYLFVLAVFSHLDSAQREVFVEIWPMNTERRDDDVGELLISANAEPGIPRRRKPIL
jgi:hypothetical protein